LEDPQVHGAIGRIAAIDFVVDPAKLARVKRQTA
jgi:hypothetical protein